MIYFDETIEHNISSIQIMNWHEHTLHGREN